MFEAIINFLRDFGIWGMFIHSFIDAIIFPIPAFFLQVTLSMANPSSALWLATVGYIASILGTPIGYMIGKLLGNKVLYKLLKKSWIDKATTMFQRNGEAAILVGAFTPIPFKVFTILAGCLNFSLWRLIGYAALGRAAKFYIVGAMFYLYGRAAEKMMGNLNYIFLALGVVIAIIYLIIVQVKKRRKANSLQQAASLDEAEESAEHDGNETNNTSTGASAEASKSE